MLNFYRLKIGIVGLLWLLPSYLFTQPVGLENCGASCYMNSVIQSMYALQPLTVFMYDNAHYYPVNTLARAYSNLTRLINIYQAGLENCLTDATCVALLTNLRINNIVQQQKKVKGPVAIPVEAINTIFFRYIDERFKAGEHDAEEFLTNLIDHFVEDAQVAYKNAAHSFINSLFRSNITYTRACKESGDYIIEKTLLNSISLPIRVESGGECSNIHRCLDDYFAPKELTGSEQIKCPASIQKEDAIEAKRLTNVPEVLILQFQRVIFNRLLKRTERIETGVTVPLEGLRLDAYGAPKNYVYDLIAVVCQRGTAGAGHYIAYVKADGTWYRCNDTEITVRNISTMKNLETKGIVDIGDSYYGKFVPYLLFYKRRQVSAILASQEQLIDLTSSLSNLKVALR